jgi:hypothetical protein
LSVEAFFCEDASGTLTTSKREQLKQQQPVHLDTDYENVNTADLTAVIGSRTYHVNDPKIRINNIGNISDDTTDGRFTIVFSSGKVCRGLIFENSLNVSFA